MIGSRRLRRAPFITGVGGGGMHTGFLWGNLKGRGQLQDISVDGRILLKWILKKFDGRMLIGLIRLRIGTDGGLL